MKNILVVKSKSRLGLKYFPFGGDADKNIGVETGPDVIQKQGALNTFPHKIINLNFPSPEDITESNYFAELSKLLAKGKNVISENLINNTVLLNLGGDHSVAFMSLLAVIERNKNKDIGYIQIDSHGDIHNSTTSPSGNFHGMWMRPFLDEVGFKEIDSLVKKKLKPQNIMYIGNLVIEKAEAELFTARNITRYSRVEIKKNIRQILEFADKFSHLHVSIDIDGFDKTIAPGTGIKAENGLFFEDVEFLLKHLSKIKSFSVDIVEYNPKKDINFLTLNLIKKIITTIFETPF